MMRMSSSNFSSAVPPSASPFSSKRSSMSGKWSRLPSSPVHRPKPVLKERQHNVIEVNQATTEPHSSRYALIGDHQKKKASSSRENGVLPSLMQENRTPDSTANKQRTTRQLMKGNSSSSHSRGNSSRTQPVPVRKRQPSTVEEEEPKPAPRYSTPVEPFLLLQNEEGNEPRVQHRVPLTKSKGYLPQLYSHRPRKMGAIATFDDDSITSELTAKRGSLSTENIERTGGHTVVVDAPTTTITHNITHGPNAEEKRTKISSKETSSLETRRKRRRFEFLKPWLRGNEEDSITLHLDDHDHRLFKRVLDRLATSKKLEQVEIIRSWSLDTDTRKTERSDDEIQVLFNTISLIPTVRSLVFWNFTQPEVAAFLGCSSTENASKSQPKQMPTIFFNLRTAFFHLMAGTLDDPRLLNRLSQFKRLEEVEVQVKTSFDVSRLMAIPTLKHLKVSSRGFVFEKEHIVKLANALSTRQKKQLRSLELEPLICASSLQTLAQAIAYNKHLQVFQFSFHGREAGTDLAIIAITDMIRSNKSLTRLVNRNYFSVATSDRIKLRLLQAIKADPVLQQCRIVEEDPTIPNREGSTLFAGSASPTKPSTPPVSHQQYFSALIKKRVDELNFFQGMTASSNIIHSFLGCSCEDKAELESQ